MFGSLKDNPNFPFYVGAAAGLATAIGYFIYKFKISQVSKYSGIPNIHVRARGPDYPRTTSVKKVEIPDYKVKWSVEFSDYTPVDYTDVSVARQPVWADDEIRLPDGNVLILRWNTIDGDVNRRSHMGEYKVVKGVPRNPVGRTGMRGRGLLGKWGPNHAADPIVTRWKRNSNGDIVRDSETGKPVLQFVAIQRSDSGEWAIPGGMVEAGESVSVTLKKEFAEEAMNVLESSQSQKEAIQKVVDEFFTNGVEVYKGYVDDPRNTDNAWMETIAVNFHDETGLGVGKFHLHAGDDACKVQWTDINKNLKLYASHSLFVQKAAELHNCHW